MLHVDTLVAKAAAHFEALTGKAPNDRELQSILNKIVARIESLPLPIQEFARSRTPEALWWHESTTKMHAKLLRHEPMIAWEDRSSALRLFSTKLAEKPAYDFTKDTEVQATWTGANYVDAANVPVTFGRDQWAHEPCRTLYAD